MRRSTRAQNGLEAAIEPTTGLPPRGKRLAKRQREKRIKYFRMGLYLFGTIALAFIGYELYLASKNLPTVTYNQQTETTIAEVHKENSNVSTDVTKAASPEASSATKATQQSIPVAKQTPKPPEQAKPNIGTEQTNAPIKQPAVATKPAEKPKAIRHRVTAGDTLFKLSRKYYGNGMGVDRIAKRNHLNPNAPLSIGRVIYIPL